MITVQKLPIGNFLTKSCQLAPFSKNGCNRWFKIVRQSSNRFSEKLTPLGIRINNFYVQPVCHFYVAGVYNCQVLQKSQNFDVFSNAEITFAKSLLLSSSSSWYSKRIILNGPQTISGLGDLVFEIFQMISEILTRFWKSKTLETDYRNYRGREPRVLCCDYTAKGSLQVGIKISEYTLMCLK